MESTAPKIVLAAELTSGWEDEVTGLWSSAAKMDTECGTQVNRQQRFLRR